MTFYELTIRTGGETAPPPLSTAIPRGASPLFQFNFEHKVVELRRIEIKS